MQRIRNNNYYLVLIKNIAAGLGHRDARAQVKYF